MLQSCDAGATRGKDIASQVPTSVVIVTRIETVAEVAVRRIALREGKLHAPDRFMITPTHIRDALRQMPLFAEFTEGEIDALMELVEPMEVAKNQVLVRQDETGECMYILVDGAVRVVHRAEGREFHLATLTVGDFFGEIALVDQGPRSADVITMEPCVLLALEQSVIRALAGVYPSAAFKLLVGVGRILIERMRQGNKKYIDSLLIAARHDDD